MTAHAHMLIVKTAVPGINRCGYFGCKHAGKVERPALAQEHSETSKAAARLIGEVRATLRNRMLAAIRATGSNGMTDEAVTECLGMNPSTERPRRIELVRMGLLIDSGKTRPTRAGRDSTVWIALAS